MPCQNRWTPLSPCIDRHSNMAALRENCDAGVAAPAAEKKRRKKKRKLADGKVPSPLKSLLVHPGTAPSALLHRALSRSRCCQCQRNLAIVSRPYVASGYELAFGPATLMNRLANKRNFPSETYRGARSDRLQQLWPYLNHCMLRSVGFRA
jgi:hypothetical protein